MTTHPLRAATSEGTFHLVDDALRGGLPTDYMDVCRFVWVRGMLCFSERRRCDATVLLSVFQASHGDSAVLQAEVSDGDMIDLPSPPCQSAMNDDDLPQMMMIAMRPT